MPNKMPESEDEIVELEPDDPPKNGEWVETCEVLVEPTDEELAEGQRLGEEQDPEDDTIEDDEEGVIHYGSGSSERTDALVKARAMKRILLDFGVPEVSIELRAGRPSSYGYWDSGFFVSDMSHHTVSRYGSNKTPVLSLCKYGRSDLPGPLCNGYGGYDLCYRIITFGYGNHPGYGGPIVVPALTAGSFRIPKDSARRYAWGTEWEGGLREADWDMVLTNPRNGKKMTMREFMGRSNAALEEALKIHSNAHLEHSTWTYRKIDRLGYTAAEGISEKKKYAMKTEDWFDMATKKELEDIVERTIKQKGGDARIKIQLPNKKKNQKEQVVSLSRAIRMIMRDHDRLMNRTNTNRISNAIIEKLPKSDSEVTRKSIENAVSKAVTEVMEDARLEISVEEDEEA